MLGFWLNTPLTEIDLVNLSLGRVAEEILLGGSSTQGASSDLEAASALARNMVDRYGFTGRGLAVSAGDNDESRRAVDALLSLAHRRATDLLRGELALLELVAAALLERDRLDRSDLYRLKGGSTVAPVASLGRPVSAPAPVLVAAPAPVRRFRRLSTALASLRPRRRV